MKDLLSPPVDAKVKDSGNNQGLRILIVDDDPLFRAGIRRQLGLLQDVPAMRLSEAGSGKDALAIVQRERMDCVLLDYFMPGGDGLRWLENIRQAGQGMAVILVTGNGDESVAVRAMKSGASDYLVKGAITPEVLLHSILNACDKARLHAQIEKQQKALIEAEKQRVMIQSLGAACHHLGQPATTLRCALEILCRRSDLPDDLREMLRSCVECSDQIAGILQSLQRMAMVRTVPYLKAPADSQDRPDSEILDVS